MAVRTTSSDVQTVMAPGGDYDLVRTPDLTPFINAASRITDRVSSCAIAKGLSLTTDELTDIEKFLTAHMYCMSDQTYASRSTGGASGSFHGQTGLNLDGTKYGQMAKMIDYSGCLNAIGMRAFASLTWLGKPVSAQVPYEDRD